MLGKKLILKKSNQEWSIKVIKIRNRYKIEINYDTKTKGKKNRVYWWNPTTLIVGLYQKIFYKI